MKGIKKADNKGFTLVELIVVLVILAILAAIMVPALLGYIDRARGSQLLLNGKSVLTAAQAESSKLYGTANSTQTIKDVMNHTHIEVVAETADTPKGSAAVFEMKTTAKTASKGNHDAWTVNKVAYGEGDNWVCFDGNSWIENLTETQAKGYLTLSEQYSFVKDSNGNITTTP